MTIQSIDLSCASLACSAETTDGSSAPLTWMFSVAGMPFLTPAQRASRATEPAAWMTQSDFLALRGGDPLAGRLAGEVLVRAEVHLRADLLVLVDAGVEGDDGDAGVSRPP